MDDDAEYMVVAKNVAGEVRSTAQVIVEPYAGACRDKHVVRSLWGRAACRILKTVV